MSVPSLLTKALKKNASVKKANKFKKNSFVVEDSNTISLKSPKMKPEKLENPVTEISFRIGKKDKNKGTRPVKKQNSLARRQFEARNAGKSLRRLRSDKGVVYFSHLPPGFYEEQIQSYCQQFGRVTGVYLPRSKIGNYRGYGFVEFEFPEVAKIVAETMNNYLMCNRLVKAKYIPGEYQKPWAFRRPVLSNAEIQAKAEEGVLNRTKDQDEERYTKKLQKKIDKHRKMLKKLNVDFQFQIGLENNN